MCRRRLIPEEYRTAARAIANYQCPRRHGASTYAEKIIATRSMQCKLVSERWLAEISRRRQTAGRTKVVVRLWAKRRCGWRRSKLEQRGHSQKRTSIRLKKVWCNRRNQMKGTSGTSSGGNVRIIAKSGGIRCWPTSGEAQDDNQDSCSRSSTVTEKLRRRPSRKISLIRCRCA